uniref:TatD related DNase n=1 Tax=Kalanchoe fedtschenkoi TaxID=63787 RepID=A0A7N0U8D6_KALFE
MESPSVQKDWGVVKQMGETYPSVIPNFGLHPWYVGERSPEWLTTLKQYLKTTPSASVGEIGLDKGTRGRTVDFTDQVEAFRFQLELAKELERPASIHCVRAFGDLLPILKDIGPFPAGIILHSYLGSAEMVPEFARLGAYFSFSGYLMSMKEQKAKKMLKTVPLERILIESDAPDALPKSDLASLFLIEGDDSVNEALERQRREGTDSPGAESLPLPKEMLNHPANIHTVLAFVANLLEMPKEQLGELSYSNAIRVFSY